MRKPAPLSLDQLQVLLSVAEAGSFAGAARHLGNLASKHALLLAGIGWGGMPEPMVRADVDAGRLVHLQLPDWRGGVYPLQVAYKNDSPPGSAGQWLIECLIDQDDRVGR